MLALSGTTSFVDGGDGRVLQTGQNLSFSLEQPNPVIVGIATQQGFADNLDRHQSSRSLLLTFVDDPHTAMAQASTDGIRPDFLGQRRGGW